MLLDPDIDKTDIQICSRCIYDERVDGIEFDKDDGVCNYCRQIDRLEIEFGTGANLGNANFQDKSTLPTNDLDQEAYEVFNYKFN